jgi:hypothetical protein
MLPPGIWTFWTSHCRIRSATSTLIA